MQAVNFAARTDVGKNREHNEDCFRVNSSLGLYVIADGMGGHASGEVASEIAVVTIEQLVMQGASLVEAIEQAHLAILKGVENGDGQAGMGTTVVAVQLSDNDYTLAWVGDSRAYLWDNGLTQISKDHSLVQMLLDSGQITQTQAHTHPRKNIIYQNLGAREVAKVQVSVKKGHLYKNQKILICSDGLSDDVANEAIDKIISDAYAAGRSDDEIVEALVDAALYNGGHDNISVIIISASSVALDNPTVNKTQKDTNKDTLIPDN